MISGYGEYTQKSAMLALNQRSRRFAGARQRRELQMNRQQLAGAALALTALVAVTGCTTRHKNTPGAAATRVAAASASASPAAAGASGAATATSGAPAAAAAGSAGATATLTTATKPVVSSGSTVDVINALRPSVVRVRTEASQSGTFGAIQSAQGTGTGMIIDNDGHVLTNNHVVTLGSNAPASRIMVDLADGQSVTAQLVGREPVADLAVLKIEAKNLTPVKFADPQSLAVGQDVVAIGYALDLGATPSVTKGVISALNRQIDETLTGGGRLSASASSLNVVGGAIQTDAAINPGNSGGPLVNLQGEVVGVSTAGILSSNGQPVQGINFAVSVDTVLPVAKALIANGKVERGFLGVQLVQIDRGQAAANRLAVNDGVGISQLTPGAAADKAGLKSGDIIVKAGNRDIHTIGDLQQALIENGPGTKLHIEYYRGADKQSADVTLGSRPSGV